LNPLQIFAVFVTTLFPILRLGIESSDFFIEKHTV